MATSPAQEEQQDPGKSKLRAAIKWIIYPLLALNVGFYLDDELLRVFQTSMSGSGFLDWTIQFVSSIETIAYVIVILMLELGTRDGTGRRSTGWTTWANPLARGVGYGLIALTIVAYGASLASYYRDVGKPDFDSLCDVANKDFSFVDNLEYTRINVDNCTTLSDEADFVYIGEPSIVTTQSGLGLERLLGWLDVIDAVAWAVLLVTIERVIYLQRRNEIGGRQMKPVYVIKTILYTATLLLAAVWAFLSHWLYTWDAVIWIAAFLIIEMNINRWRDEIRDKLGLVPV